MRKNEIERAIIRPCAVSVVLLMALFVLSSGSFAQSTTDGAIGGTVTDASGAAVPGAKVSVKSLGTNAEEVVTSDDTGYFRVGKLQPATYSVTVSAQGFGPFTVEHVVVQVGSVTDVVTKLNVASAGATVVVTAEIPQVNTNSAEFAPTVDQNAINNLPINGGRWSNFVLLTPGAVSDASGFGLISFRGMSTLLNNNTVDGGDNNQAFFSEERGRTRIGYSSAKAAVQEFQVNTSNYSAEYGRAAGAVVNTVTKSGSNAYHGEVYFYDRDNSWGAFNPFTTLTKQTSPGVFTTSPYNPVDVRKMYGFGVGGPIKKDRIFFFFAFDRYDRNFPGTAKATSPTAFFAAPLGAITPAYTVDGTTNCFQSNGKSNINSSAFTSGSAAIPNGGNIATATVGACTLLGNLSNASVGIAAYSDAVTDYNNGLNGLLNETGPVPRKGQATIFFPKIDWQISPKNHATFEVNRTRWFSPAGIQTQASNTFGVASFGNDYVRDTWGVAKLYTSISSSLTNEARFQYGRDFEFEFAQPPTAYEQTNFVTSPNFPGYTNPLGLPPDVFITNGFDMGVPTFLQRPAFPDERRTQYADTVSWSHGKHALKFGMDVAHTNDLSENLRFQYGSFSYTTVGNYLSDLISPNHCGTSQSSSCYSSYQQAFGPLGFTFNTNDLAFFAEDSWRVLPRFTLNLGLRYEYEMLPSVILPNPVVPQTQSMPSDKNNLGPRIGFAWDVNGDGKTAVRGGYGIYFGRVINSSIYNALTNTGVNGAQFSFFFTTAGAGGGATFPQILPTAPPPSSGLNIVFFDPNFQLPQIHETDFTVEREIFPNTVVSVSYMGSFGRSLPDFVDINTGAPLQNISYKVTGGPLGGATYTTPYYGTITTVVKDPSGTLISTTCQCRPNPNFGAMSEIFSGISSNYNALAIQLNHRMAKHLQFMGSYTWSHSLDFGQNASTFSDTNDLLVPTDIHLEYGNSIFNVPNRFVANAIVESPWHVNGPLGYLTNDWQLSPIYAAQSGLPYSLVTSGNPPRSVTSTTDPVTGDLTTVTIAPLGGGVNGSNGRKGIDIIGRNTFQMKRTINMDVRLSKRVRFGDRYSAEVLGEAFNLFNHQNVTSINSTGYFVGGTFAAPTLSFNSPFGSVTNSNSNFAYSPRQIQIGFRFFF
ncbi:MAG TPA: carboxypeptidase regulatory-like domain-containing protein [Candidatus Acidoferrum sp.]|nr:carboxypeptidase regulatory-like domain-containing protein [Candidatus Acidoferrum sp.]